MRLCRTCLSQDDLNPIFPNKELIIYRSKQLYEACGVKIHVDDGLSQLICGQCSNLVEGSLKLRTQSQRTNKFLTAIKIESDLKYCNLNLEQNTDLIILTTTSNTNKKENQNLNIEQSGQEVKTKEVSNKESTDMETKTSSSKEDISNVSWDDIDSLSDSDHALKPAFSVGIEDFESSNDSDVLNDFLVHHIDSYEDDGRKVRIEDFESSDSLDLDQDNNILAQEFGESSKKKEEIYKVNEKDKEDAILERERRKLFYKERDQKILSLAVTPYDIGGPIKCKLCNKVMKNLANFKAHVRTHLEPQNTCEECGKKFVLPCHMRYHQQRVHGRKKRLACTKCNYRAVDRLQLKNHMRAEHTGERPYICDVCGYSFRMRANIVQHMRKHFGVRNLQCERCPAMFRSRSELWGHQHKVHNVKYTYWCYLCPASYRKQEPVKKHLLKVHGIPLQDQLSLKCIKTKKGD